MRTFTLIACILTAGSIPCAATLNVLLMGSETEGMSAANHGIDTNATGGLLGDGITFDPETNMLTFNMGYGSAADDSFVDLGSDYTTSHFHIIAGPVDDPLDPSASGGVAIALEPFHTPMGARSGTYSGSAELTAEQVSALMESRLYVNVHSSTHPGGEIRGNLVVDAYADYPIDSGYINTDMLGWLFVGPDGWLHSDATSGAGLGWLFMPEEHITPEGGWAFLTRE